MAWISPVSRATGFLVTAARWNQDIVDNGIDLNDRLTSLEADDDPISTAGLADSAVTSAKLANGAVTGDKLAASLLEDNVVGSYILARWAHNPPTEVQTRGATVAGSNLIAAATRGLSGGGNLSGTWRLMGYSSTGNTNWQGTTSLYVRIS